MPTSDDFKKIYKELMEKHDNPFKDVKMNEPGGVAARRVAQRLGITLGQPTVGNQPLAGPPAPAPQPNAAQMGPPTPATNQGRADYIRGDKAFSEEGAKLADEYAGGNKLVQMAQDARTKQEDSPVEATRSPWDYPIDAAATIEGGEAAARGAGALFDMVAPKIAPKLAEVLGEAKPAAEMVEAFPGKSSKPWTGKSYTLAQDAAKPTLEEAKVAAAESPGEFKAAATDDATNAGKKADKTAHIKALLDTHSKLVENHAKLIDSLIKSDAE